DNSEPDDREAPEVAACNRALAEVLLCKEEVEPEPRLVTEPRVVPDKLEPEEEDSPPKILPQAVFLLPVGPGWAALCNLTPPNFSSYLAKITDNSALTSVK